MPDMTVEIVDKAKKAGFRYVRFDGDSQLEVSKDPKKDWRSFECEQGKSFMTVPRFMVVDLDSL